MKLTRRKLQNMILKEMQRLMDEDALVHRHNPGVLAKHDDPGRQMSYASGRKCYECGAKMYEGEKSCAECGSMYEEINEGSCGGCGTCNTCGPADYDMDNDFIPDNMEKLNKTNILPDEALGLGIKIGNHKIYKGSYMAKSHLYKVNKYAAKLYHMIPDGHNLEDWMRSKIAQIADDIGEVYHAIDHDIFDGDI